MYNNLVENKSSPEKKTLKFNFRIAPTAVATESVYRVANRLKLYEIKMVRQGSQLPHRRLPHHFASTENL